MLYRIALADDDFEVIRVMETYLHQIEQERNLTFQITVYHNGITLWNDFKSQFDIILMDIDMPHLNGMETAERIRKLDEDVILIFITNLTDYAVRGYSVHAYSYFRQG